MHKPRTGAFFCQRQSGNAPPSGFTLIELLVVIAIIAILAAIIFPVFNSVRENAREATTMSNLHDISSALALYKLDNRRYPDVLFAYACNGQLDSVTGKPCSVGDTMADVAQDPNSHDLLVGLYPEYIKDWQSFTCPNNLITSNSATTTLPDNILCPKENAAGGAYADSVGYTPCSAAGSTGQLFATKHTYFLADAMDVSPEVVNVNQFAGGNNTPGNWDYVPRYQTSWMSYDTGSGGNGNASDPDYIRQLRWINPPADTYVTSVTYHVPNSDRLIVLYESGSAQVQKVSMPGSWFNNPSLNSSTAQQEIAFDDSQPSIAVTANGGNSPAYFWRFKAGQ